MTDKLYAVLETTDDGDVVDSMVFVRVYRSREAAVAAIETAMLETWEMARDPNGPPDRFPSISGGPDAYYARIGDVDFTWTITEVEISQ